MKLFAQKEAQDFVKTGAKELRYGRDLRLTPGAKDVLSEAGVKLVFVDGAPAPAAVAAPAAGPSSAGGARPDVLALFNSPEAQRLKAEIIDVGHRSWLRSYNDGNGGNISCRLGEYFLCTPTGVSKGFMKPEMICLVDGQGNQLAGNGTWKRTSEILTHMGIYRAVPHAQAVFHAHPIYATAFAMAGVEPPQCLIPEVEVFVGTIPVAPYKTPGSSEMSEIIGSLAPKHQSIMMGNHGLICWGSGVEDAFFKMEITDSYCRTLVVASQIPTKRTTIPPNEMQKLLEMKQKLGLPDERLGLKPAQLCECDPWEFIADKPVACATPAGAPAGAPISATNAELEALVARITDEVVKSLQK